MKKGVIILLLLLIALTGCTEVSEETTDKDEITGHGVIICGEDYKCGNADQVCPEDYGAECKVKDPDCK